MKIPLYKKVLLLFILFAPINFVFAQTPFECDGSVYVSVVDVEERVQLFELLDNRSEINFIPFDSIMNFNVNAIGYRKTDNFIYGIDPQLHYLYRIDATGNIEQLNLLLLEENYYAGDVSPDGKHLVLFNGNSISKVSLEDFSAPVEYIETVSDTAQMLIASTDIAFHPQTGVLYGYDGVGGRLITIDPNTGFVDNTSFEPTGYNNTIPALFFNPLGELKGIATNNSNQESIFFQFDLETGQAKRSNSVDKIGDRDACSCPYTLQVEAAFRPLTAYPCTKADYVVKIGNFGSEAQSNSAIAIEFPYEFEIGAILNNPFGGTATLAGEGNLFYLEAIEIPIGVDSIVFQVEIPENANGNYQVQASLESVGALSGIASTYLSDNPYTFEKNDPSSIEIVPLDLGTATSYSSSLELCEADTLQLDFLFIEGLQYTWNTGDTTAFLNVTSAGDYTLQIKSFCDSVSYDIEIWDTDIALDLGASLEKNFNETFSIIPEIQSMSTIESYQWTVDSDIPLSCNTCPSLPIQATQDALYNLTITNTSGCSAMDEISLQVNRPIFAPNAFSPNYDGVNDLFYLNSVQPSIALLSFAIFDRWGGQLYQTSGQTNDLSIGWDGRYKNKEMKQGIYIWTALLEYPDGKQVEMSGDIFLTR